MIHHIIVFCHLSILLLFIQIQSTTSSVNTNPNRESKCIAVDSYHTYICSDNPEASRRAVSSSFTDGTTTTTTTLSSAADGGGSSGSNDDNSIMATAFDMNLGVEQRITGSETEQLRIRNVLRKMYTYFEEEVLSRSEYEHVRGRW